LSDDDKQRMSDSLRGVQNALLASGYPPAEQGIMVPCPATPPVGTGTGGGRAGASGVVSSPSEDRTGCISIIQTSVIPTVGGFPARLMPPLPPMSDLIRGGPVADYLPPIGPNATLADRDANLWILPRISTLSKNGELVYDVV